MNKIKNIFKKVKITKRELTLIAVSMMIIVLFLSGYSIGKGFFETDIKTNAQIAEPILIVDNNPAIHITSSNNFGSYDFKVRNYDDEEKITQTDLKYNIEIISKVNENIKVKLYKDEDEIKIENNKTKDAYFHKNVKEVHNYRLEITYDESKNANINDAIQDVQIKVHSEQMKVYGG